jgi:hypothetical protein
MRITNLSELRSSIAHRLDRADAVPSIPTFIQGAEDAMNRELRTRDMESRSTATLTGEYLALPTDFLELRNVQLNTNPPRVLEIVSPEQMDRRWRAMTGIPAQYCVIGDEFQFAPVPADSTYTCEIAYYSTIPALTDAADVNWALTKHPMLYLYGALSVAGDMTSDPRSGQWAALFAQNLESVRRADRRGRWSGSALMMKVR